MKIALTFWFTFATLSGLGACCCRELAQPVSTAAGVAPATAAPLKSCCRPHEPQAAPSSPTTPKEAPSKCPCEKHESLMAVPMGGDATAELARAIQQADSQPACDRLLHGSASVAAGATPAPGFDPLPPRSGRTLLAAYCILRC